MWKKEDVPVAPPAPQAATAPRTERTPSAASGEMATIGRSITIRGEVTGDEDLLIQGRVDGSVDLRAHSITVGSEGDVKASIVGRIVTVQGRVEGNITAEEQVILRNSAWVQGDILAPRVVLEDGARFRGGVDMGESADKRRSASNGVSTQAQPRKDAPRSEPIVDTQSNKGKTATDTAAGAAV